MSNESSNIIKTQPLLTIAIPTYNGSKTIKVMMDILLAQYDSRVEILVSDNCSTDATPQIISDYLIKYPYIKYIRNEKNIGADANFLQCMRLASGKFIHLLSDDDVMFEGALAKVLKFLETNNDVTLVYLYTKGFRGTYVNEKNCSEPSLRPLSDICSTDKKEFMKYASYYWGFMSSFIISKEHFDRIINPEQYFGTYWLQSYIHILCCSGSGAKVGVVAGPCIGAGIYVNVSNFDASYVDGVSYRRMLDFAIDHGFNKRQLSKLYRWRIIFLGSHSVIKERGAGMKKTSLRGLFKCTWKFPEAYIKLYPIFLIPSFLCRMIMSIYRKRKNMGSEVGLNREGDTAS